MRMIQAMKKIVTINKEDCADDFHSTKIINLLFNPSDAAAYSTYFKIILCNEDTVTICTTRTDVKLNCSVTHKQTKPHSDLEVT